MLSYYDEICRVHENKYMYIYYNIIFMRVYIVFQYVCARARASVSFIVGVIEC